MQTLIRNVGVSDDKPTLKSISNISFLYADAMLKERSK